MRKRMNVVFSALALCLLFVQTSCIMDEKTVDILVRFETCAEFDQNEQGATWDEETTVDVSQDIDDALTRNGLSRDDIKLATLKGAAYMVTGYTDGGQSWTIGGSVNMTRTDVGAGPVLAFAYQSGVVSVAEVDQRHTVALDPAGVAMLQGALDDFIDEGANPVFTFTMNNGSVAPIPTQQMPLIFQWKAFLTIEVIYEETVEIPDP